MIGVGLVLASLIAGAWVETGTTTATAAVGAGDVPLSAEDLALIKSLEAGAATATAAATAPATPALEPLVGRFFLARGIAFERLASSPLRDGLARSVAEAVASETARASIRRRFPSGDAIVIRGRSGHRVPLLLDGVSLHHTLSSVTDSVEHASIDPFMLADLTARTGDALALSGGGGGAGLVELEMLQAPEEAGVAAEARAEARTADRSAGVHATAAAANDSAGARVSGSFGDQRSLRAGGSRGNVADPHQRTAMSARGRLLGTQRDPFGVVIGFDYDRLTDVPRPDLHSVERKRDRQLVLARAYAGGRSLGGTLVLARQRFGVARETATEDVTSYQARGEAHLEIVEGLTARAGGELQRDDAEASELRGDSTAGGAFAELGLDTRRIDARALAKLFHARTRAGAFGALEAAEIDTTKVLTEGGASLNVHGPFSLHAAWSQSAHLPTVADLARRAAGAPLVAERTITAEGGARFELEPFSADATFFHTWIADAIEPTAAGQLANQGDARIWGIEGRAQATLFDRLELSLILTHSAGELGGEPLSGVPGLAVQGAARYTFPIRNAYLEASARAATPLERISPVERLVFTLAERDAWSHVRFAVRGAVDVGLGFRALLVLDNLLDADYAPHGSGAALGGVDFRAALAYAWP